MSADLLPFVAPIALLLGGAANFVNRGRRLRLFSRMAEASALVAVLVAVVSALVLVVQGPGDVRLIGLFGFGLSI